MCVCVFRLTAMLCQTDRMQLDRERRHRRHAKNKLAENRRWKGEKGWRMSNGRQAVWVNPHTDTQIPSPSVLCTCQTICAVWLSAHKLRITPKNAHFVFIKKSNWSTLDVIDSL